MKLSWTQFVCPVPQQVMQNGWPCGPVRAPLTFAPDNRQAFIENGCLCLFSCLLPLAMAISTSTLSFRGELVNGTLHCVIIKASSDGVAPLCLKQSDQPQAFNIHCSHYSLHVLLSIYKLKIRDPCLRYHSQWTVLSVWNRTEFSLKLSFFQAFWGQSLHGGTVEHEWRCVVTPYWGIISWDRFEVSNSPVRFGPALSLCCQPKFSTRVLKVVCVSLGRWTVAPFQTDDRVDWLWSSQAEVRGINVIWSRPFFP